MSIEMNCFRIEGLATLLTQYRLFQILGLPREGGEYYANIQRIIRRLSFQMRAPVTTHDVHGECFLVIPKGYGNPPDYITLVGTVATLKDTGQEIEIRFDVNSDELDPVRLRFLQFAIQNPLWSDSRLWLPSTGRPFFSKNPDKQLGSLDLFTGFALRIAPHPEGGFGLIVDLRRKLLSRSSLGANVTRDQITKLKGRSCVYRMGNKWFEVSLSGMDDRKVGQPSIPWNGKPVSLLEYLHTQSPKPVPPSIAHLKTDGSAIYYRTTGPQQKAAPAELCYLVEDTHTAEGARNQPETVIDPQTRYPEIKDVIETFFKSIKVGNTVLSVRAVPSLVSEPVFQVPALRFGKDATLRPDSFGNRDAAIQEYGRRRMTLLSHADAGFYVRSLFDRQYLVLPRSIANSSGERFIADLKTQVEALYPDGGGYNPEVIEYDDLTGSRDFVGQSRAIKAALEAAGVMPGFAVVMQHRHDRRPRSADQLAAWTVKELSRQFELQVSVIHTDMVKRAYGTIQRNGETQYAVKEPESRRFQGYLRNVAINKILLTNGKWPFVLDTHLHADIVIGIDVKNSTAAFTLIADGGRIIRFQTSPSKQKEQLLRSQVAKYVSELITKEANHVKRRPKAVVIHRDGRSWPCEIDGIRDACQALAKRGVLDDGWQLTVVEISKSAPAPLRFFNTTPSNSGRGPWIENPSVGCWTKFTGGEAYVCTTGRPFKIPGTAIPLHIKRAYGEMPIEQCAGDVFSLSCLTWPRPEGAMRLPISIKLCDRTLFEEAADYDEDAIEFAEDASGGTQ
jgi:hypothetical protein